MIAERIWRGGGPYFMIKYLTHEVIAFDTTKRSALRRSGPYLQYAVVRANNIFPEDPEREGLTESAVLAALPSTRPDALLGARRP